MFFQSDDDTSDEEKQAEIDKKKDEEAKAKAKLEALKTESKLPSGASSKGNNTPSGRPKHSDPTRKFNKLKRPGSPNLSESSGNESTRKKQKKHATQPGSSTPAGSRALSPSQSASGPLPLRSSTVKNSVNSNRLTEINSHSQNPSSAMSDGEATGGEMTDGGKRKKLKLRLQNSPGNSRAGSPAARGTGSRAASPGMARIPKFLPELTRIDQAKSASLGPITAEELKAAIPQNGITIGGLMKIFSNRIGDAKENKTDKKQFIQMVKVFLEFGPDRSLKVRSSAPAVGGEAAS